MNLRVAIPAACAALGLGGLAVFLAGSPSVPQRALPEGSPPHVVVVVGCTVRADQVSLYGGEPEATPFLSQLAAQGAFFERTIGQAPWTRPAVTALLTGQLPARTGIVEPGPQRNDRRLLDDVTTLAQHFGGAGYATIGLTGNSNLNPLFGFDRGFDTYRATDKLWRKGLDKVEGTQLVDEALALVDAAEPGKPLYLQLVLVDAHLPATVSDEEIGAFKREGVKRRLAQYRAMLHQFDEAVEALDAGLEQRGLDPDNTVFVVIADHGEGLKIPAHHGNGHGNYLYPSSVHVPWIMRGPGVAAGAEITGLSAQIDLAPTLLSVADVEHEATFDGVDHSALLGAGGAIGPRSVYTDTWFREVHRAAIYEPERMCQVDLDPEGTVAMLERTAKKKKRKPKFQDACFLYHDDAAFESPVAEATEALARVRSRAEELELVLQGRGATVVDVDAQTKGQLEALGYVE